VTRTRARDRASGRPRVRLLSCALLAAACALAAGCAPAALPFGGLARASTPPAPSALCIQVEERYYTVSGRSASALNQALVLSGPRRGGRVAHALTEWRLGWSYVPVQGAAGCVSARPRVEVRLVTTLPAWADLDYAPPPLASDWALFLDRLRDHEFRHQDIAVDSGNELLGRLGGLVAGTCEELRAEAERAARRVAANHEAIHARFDQATSYGLVTGAP